MKKRNIEILGENGWYKEKKYDYKLLVLFFVCILTIGLLSVNSFSKYNTKSHSKLRTNVADFDYTINANRSKKLNIDLNETIINDYYSKRVIPGSFGKIVFNLDFINTDVDIKYIINPIRVDVPNNIKLYSDDTFTNEIETKEGLILKNSYKDEVIYWKWIYKDDPISNENDNLYQNKNISIDFDIDIEQNIK